MQGGFRLAKVSAKGVEVFVHGGKFLDGPLPVWKPCNGGEQALVHGEITPDAMLRKGVFS